MKSAFSRGYRVSNGTKIGISGGLPAAGDLSLAFDGPMLTPFMAERRRPSRDHPWAFAMAGEFLSPKLSNEIHVGCRFLRRSILPPFIEFPFRVGFRQWLGRRQRIVRRNGFYVWLLF